MTKSSSFKIPTPKTVQDIGGKRFVPPVIPFERPGETQKRKDQFLTFKLRSVPTEEGSTTYDLSIPFFDQGSPEELLIFLNLLGKVFVGQNVTTGPQKYAITRRLLTGDALSAFNSAAATAGNETLDHFKMATRGLISHVFPVRALQLQKQYMRRYLRKPLETKIRNFMSRLVEINSYLTEFPPYAPNQSLPMDEVLEIATFAVPAKWQKAMNMHGFDATLHSPSEFVEFCERLEFSETGDNHHSKAQRNSGTDLKGGKKAGISQAKSSARGTKRSKDDKFCILHNTYGHSLDECKVMQDQAKRMRASFEAKTNHKNHTWSRKDHEQKKKKSEEIHAIVAEAVNKALNTKKKEQEEEAHNLDALLNLNLEESNSESE